MENLDMKINILNDGKEKWQSWTLDISITADICSYDNVPSYLGGGFGLYETKNISMYDSSFERLKENSIKELERLKSMGYVNEFCIEKVKQKFKEYIAKEIK